MLFAGIACLSSVALLAQNPVVMVDFDMSGRQLTEVNDPKYTSWVADNLATIAKTYNGVTFTFKKTGTNGTALKADWYKTGVQSPYFARLVCDGIIVQNGDAGAEVELTISGLPKGKHTLLAYHNSFANPASTTFAPIDVFVNGTQVYNDLIPSNRALTNNTVALSYLTFEVKNTEDIVILYKAEASSTASMKNVYINGFELNTPNVRDQAKIPIPNDADEHVDADKNYTKLSWIPADNAVSHQVYFGTDLAGVQDATTTSSYYKGNQVATTIQVDNLYSMNTYYWRVDEVAANGIVTKGNVWYFRPRQLAFAGAEGYGRFARGGRFGKVVYVTNLNDSGPGSLREAVTNDIGPRTIMFNVSGVISLESRLVLSQPYVTIAGQTAPGKGICIRKAPFGLSGAKDVILRNIRVRLGAGATYDGMGMQGSDHSILDHCSISWTIDESFSSRSGKNITLQRTLISEALNVAGHQNYPAGTGHGYAATISGDIGSFHHNLLAHCAGRNWSLGGGLDGDGKFSGRLDIFNNVVYNWSSRTTDGGAHEVNFVNNYYKPGAASKIFTALNPQYENFPGTQKYYFVGNVMPGYFNESNQDLGQKVTGTPQGYTPWVTTPFFPSYATIHTATGAFKNVLSDVGANQPIFDDHDVRMVDETLNGTYKYKGSVSGLAGLPDNESDVGGYENYPEVSRATNWDSDLDGLPDFWEKYFDLNPNSTKGDFSDSNADLDKDGFTRLDAFMDWMASPHFFLEERAQQQLDLTAFFKGFSKSSPTYVVSDVSDNISVNINAGVATITANYCGMASLKLKVTDAANETMTKVVNVFVGSLDKGKCVITGLETEPLVGAKVYPNPFTESINLESEGSFTYQVYSLDGKLLESGKGTEQASIGSQLPAGAYLVYVAGKSSSKSIKIIKAQ